MKYVGLISSIAFYAVILCEILIYFILICQKKYEKANHLFSICFLSSCLTLMILSWALIMINNGSFSIFFTIEVNFTITLAVIIPVIAMIIPCDIILRKHIEQKNGLQALARYIEPALVICLFILLTLVFYFNLNYFEFMKLL